MLIKPIMLCVMVLTIAYEIWIHYLAAKSENNPVPSNVADIYDRETYLKWKKYHAEKNRLSVISTLTESAVFFVLLLGNVYAVIAEPFKEQPFFSALAVILFFQVISTIVSLPFSYYSTMKIEQEYGFNRYTGKLFWVDQLKNFLIDLILTGGLLCAFIAIHLSLGDWVLLLFTCFLFLFLLLGSFLFPVLARIFNKFTPLEDGSLKTRLTAMLEKYGYHVRAILVSDASRRSSKANAYFAGFGKMKTIVLYDTLLKSFTDDEICAVFAHEMGHGLHKDTLRRQYLSFINVFLIALFAWLNVSYPEISLSFGFDRINYGFALLLLLQVELPLISPLLGFVSASVSRKHEFRADHQTVVEGFGAEMISGLKKIGRENFADLSPDPLLVKLTYDHPPLSARIEAIEAAIRESHPIS